MCIRDSHHTALALLTPADVHYGQAEDKLHQRQIVLQQAYAAHPERFVKGVPVTPTLPDAIWINPPKGDTHQKTDVLKPSDLGPACGETATVLNGGSDALGCGADLSYTSVAGAEGRATLRSDLSADAGDGVTGQGLTDPAHTIQHHQLYRQQSDKPTDLAAASLALIAANPHERRAGPTST